MTALPAPRLVARDDVELFDVVAEGRMVHGIAWSPGRGRTVQVSTPVVEHDEFSMPVSMQVGTTKVAVESAVLHRVRWIDTTEVRVDALPERLMRGVPIRCNDCGKGMLGLQVEQL